MTAKNRTKMDRNVETRTQRICPEEESEIEMHVTALGRRTKEEHQIHEVECLKWDIKREKRERKKERKGKKEERKEWNGITSSPRRDAIPFLPPFPKFHSVWTSRVIARGKQVDSREPGKAYTAEAHLLCIFEASERPLP
jgi:hypothetical protein